MTALDRLRDALENRTVIVVVGTGITSSIANHAAASTWSGLISDGISHVERRSEDEGALLQIRLEAAKNPEDLTSIAQDLKRHLGDDFGRWLGQSIGGLLPTNKSIALALQGLGAPILTTNYDDLLERILGFTAATWSRPDDMRLLIMKGLDAIGHLHGVWREPDGVIFSESDYRRIVEDTAAQSVQTSAFNLKTFLFIGCGAGLDDPNFSPMIRNFGEAFPTSANSHFRLCRTSEVDPATALKPVVDIGYGDEYEDLTKFLTDLSKSIEISLPSIDVTARSHDQILDRLRDNSTLWRDADSLDEKSFTDLIIPPIFLPEPHDQYKTNSVVSSEKDRAEPVDISAVLKQPGIVVIVGEENSGVSTAIQWSLHEAMNLRPDAHAILIDDPLLAGKRPVGRVIDRTYREWGLDVAQDGVVDRGMLGVDNLRFEDSDRFRRAINDVCDSAIPLKILGVRQEDAVAVVNALNDNAGDKVRVVYLGRFSNVEARELARRVAPGREDTVARTVMVIVREKNLPRTPFTITLLVELVQSGVLLQKEESETAVLDQYINLLLHGEFIRSRKNQGMTLRNKRLVLESLARRFVEKREDKAPQAQVLEWLAQQFSELGWTHDALTCINDLIDRRILARGQDNTIRFQRSAYLELMAGLAAKDDLEFRKLVFAAPIQLASIVRTYAAMTRNDAEVLTLIEGEIDRISVSAPSGAIFASVRRLEAGKALFAERSESDADGDSQSAADEAIERQGLSGTYYDDSDDSDSPAFMTARLEDLSQSRLAMLVVDLASRVLRDSDEVRDQELKERILIKLLVAWVSFTDLYEAELASAPDIDEAVAHFYPDGKPTDEALEGFKSALLRIVPSFLTLSGIRTCLSSPSLVKRLAELDFVGVENGSYAALIRTLALYSSDSSEWVDSLKSIDDLAIKTFFSAAFIASLARYAFVANEDLTETHRDKIRDFLRRVVEVRYTFKDLTHKGNTLNSFEAGLRRDRLDEGHRGKKRLEAAR
jgi:hypothetical protein